MKYWRIDGNDGNAYYHTSDALRMARLFYRVFDSDILYCSTHMCSGMMYSVSVFVMRSDEENKFGCDPLSYVFALVTTADTVSRETMRQYFADYLYKHPAEVELGMSWDLQLVKCEVKTRQQYEADFPYFLASHLCLEWFASTLN